MDQNRDLTAPSDVNVVSRDMQMADLTKFLVSATNRSFEHIDF
jgi:hypothetical protein